MRKSIRIGSRQSALARVQTKQIADALQHLDPSLKITYHFIESSGDRSTEPNAGLITARGGFTEDLGRMLDDGVIDLAVHSWKDLPLSDRANSAAMATLPRADARDVLLLRRESLRHATSRGLTILSSSARRRHHLEEFLAWALPIRPANVRFSPVRGAIETRLRKLLRGDGDGLVIAKAAIDRLIESAPAQLAAAGTESVARLHDAQKVVRQALLACRTLVLPLEYCPAAPAQGALAIEAPNNTPLKSILSAVNDTDTFDLVTQERHKAQQVGDQYPLGITLLRFEYGDVQFLRGGPADDCTPRRQLFRNGNALPRPDNAASIWCGDESRTESTLRSPLLDGPQRFDATTGLLVARSEALPTASYVDDHTVVWTPGLTTWRKLAARGYWVVGSDESLGETGAQAIRHWFPAVRRWLKLTHTEGYPQPDSELVPAYHRSSSGQLADISRHTHFFWRSGSQLRDYLSAFPALEAAWHGCGPGNTWRIARELLDRRRLAPYLSAEQFRAELLT